MSDFDLPRSTTPVIDSEALAVASRLAVGVLNGLMIKGTTLDVATRYVQEPHLCDQFFANAVRLIEINKEHRPDMAEQRLDTVVSLFAGALSGYVANQTQPLDALNKTRRDRDRLFAVANSLISAAMDRPKHDSQARPNNLGNAADAFSRGRNMADNQSGGSGIRPSSGQRPR
jgi:hypothetical protein